MISNMYMTIKICPYNRNNILVKEKFSENLINFIIYCQKLQLVG